MGLYGYELIQKGPIGIRTTTVVEEGGVDPESVLVVLANPGIEQVFDFDPSKGVSSDYLNQVFMSQSAGLQCLLPSFLQGTSFVVGMEESQELLQML